MSKPKVAFFDFSSCEGCQIELTNMGTDLATLILDHVELVEFREIMKESTTEQIDISFIEGSFTREKDRARLENIRERSNIVVAFGACATTGGINALKNHMPVDEYKNMVYGKDKDMPHLETQEAKPIDAAIKVDYKIHGCPMSRHEFVHVVSHLLHGKEPVIPNYPVCVECKRRETVCVYELGTHCMGPVARAGCNAPCPSVGIPCEACRGFIDEPNLKSIETVMQRNGMPPEYAKIKGRIFTANCIKEGE